MPPRRRAGDDPDDPLDDDFDTVRVRPSYDDEIFDEPIYTPGRGHVPTIIDAPFVETVDPPPVLPPLPPPMAPMTPPIPPTTPFVRPAPARRGARKGNDWTPLVIALIISSVIMAACCLAGLALFSTTNPGT
jgi:hypothetical protein